MSLEEVNTKLDIVILSLDKILQLLNSNGDSRPMPQIPELRKYTGGELSSQDIFKLSKPLQTTYLILIKYAEASTDQIAHETGKQRPVESSLLNQLVQMGLATKYRKGRTVYFKISELETQEERENEP